MFNFDRKTLLIILGVFLVLNILSAGTEGILATLFMIPGVLIAITFHEFAHAWTAYKLGDETPRMQGRLNLNPMSHIDPLGIVFLIVAGFGWGKPVQINSKNFDGKYSISKAEAIVSAAGPIMNFILAFIFMVILYVVFYATDIASGLNSNIYTTLYGITYSTIAINIGLGVFNLIPVPPLDGSKILMHFLPFRAKQWFYGKEYMFYLIFILLLITGLSNVILEPIFSLVFNGLSWAAGNLVGLFL